MQKIIVSETSCLILFHKIGQIELLHKIFGEIIITEAVALEFKKPIAEWMKVINPSKSLPERLNNFLDLGEASSIALASELKDCLLIIDESKGRKVAKELGILITGSLGILVIAKRKGILTSIKPIIEKIEETDFRLSTNLIEKILQQANEK